jgi:hypothetical protein
MLDAKGYVSRNKDEKERSYPVRGLGLESQELR